MTSTRTHIVVGVELGEASMREFLNGSVAVHLAHRQSRPVVVIPLHPVRSGAPLPWQDDS